MPSRIALMGPCFLSLVAAGPAAAQMRDYQAEANARGLNLVEYMGMVKSEEMRREYTHGAERPGPADYPPYWESGYRSGLHGLAVGDLNARTPAFRHGYEAGQRQAGRNAQAEAARRQPLLDRYGSVAAADAWDRGFQHGEGGSKENPPGVEDASSYLAYGDGYEAGKRSKATGEGGEAAAQLKPRGEDAIRYAEEYVKHLNYVALYSDEYYLLFDAYNEAFHLPKKHEPSLAESIARSKFAIELTKEAIRLHGLINSHAYLAYRLQPALIAAMEAQASERLAAMSKLEVQSNRDRLLEKAEELASEARRLRAEPVTLPASFEPRGRHQRELLYVLTDSLETDHVRAALAARRNDASGARVGKFGVFAASWRDGQAREHEEWKEEFNKWLEKRFPRSYPSGYGPPPEIAEKAREEAAPFLVPPAIATAEPEGPKSASPTAANPAEAPSPSATPPARDRTDSPEATERLERLFSWAGYVVVGIVIVVVFKALRGS